MPKTKTVCCVIKTSPLTNVGIAGAFQEQQVSCCVGMVETGGLLLHAHRVGDVDPPVRGRILKFATDKQLHLGLQGTGPNIHMLTRTRMTTQFLP